MAGVETIDKKKIEYSGYFDLDELYQLLRDVVGEDYHYVIFEREYYRNMDKGEVEIRWECTKNVTDFIQYKIDITTYVSNLEKGEVKRGGRNVRLEKGNVEIHLTAHIKTDYMVRWESSSILKFLKGIYRKFLISSAYEKHEDKVSKELWSIADELKGFFQLRG